MTKSWETAFQKETSPEDKALLRKTPIQVSHVDSKAEVQTAIGVLGWTQAILEVKSVTLTELETLARTAGGVRERLLTVNQRLEQGLDLIQTMKETSSYGVSVWDAATTLAPSLSQFETGARELSEELEDRAEQADTIRDRTISLLMNFKAVRASRVTAFGQLPEAVTTAVSEYEQLIQELVKIQERLRTLKEISTEAIEVSRELPVMGTRVKSFFENMHTLITKTNQKLEEFQTELDALQDKVVNTRQSASAKANQRYQPISKLATGSPDSMNVMSIDTNVEAYDNQMVETPQRPTPVKTLTPTPIPTDTEENQRSPTQSGSGISIANFETGTLDESWRQFNTKSGFTGRGGFEIQSDIAPQGEYALRGIHERYEKYSSIYRDDLSINKDNTYLRLYVKLGPVLDGAERANRVMFVGNELPLIIIDQKNRPGETSGARIGNRNTPTSIMDTVRLVEFKNIRFSQNEIGEVTVDGNVVASNISFLNKGTEISSIRIFQGHFRQPSDVIVDGIMVNMPS